MGSEVILIVFYVIVLIYSIILHEISHGIVALWLGDVTAKYAGRLTLNPKTHIDPIGSILVPGMLLLASMGQMAFGWARPVPYNPYNLRNQKWGELAVALAGPAINIFLATIAVILSKIIILSSAVKEEIIRNFRNWSEVGQILSGSLESIFFLLLVYIVFWNIVLALFNLIPIPPLDGSKILYSIFPIDAKVKIFLEQYGFFFLLFVLFFFGEGIQIILSWGISLFFNFMI
ncbi:MAG: site-2 protease family protein [Candidatus Moranbacteria bacterium]|nr:site-2 protease family protein [Candidatus Moranbacteria bacterium]